MLTHDRDNTVQDVHIGLYIEQDRTDNRILTWIVTHQPCYYLIVHKMNNCLLSYQ